MNVLSWIAFAIFICVSALFFVKAYMFWLTRNGPLKRYFLALSFTLGCTSAVRRLEPIIAQYVPEPVIALCIGVPILTAQVFLIRYLLKEYYLAKRV